MTPRGSNRTVTIHLQLCFMKVGEIKSSENRASALHEPAWGERRRPLRGRCCGEHGADVEQWRHSQSGLTDGLHGAPSPHSSEPSRLAGIQATALFSQGSSQCAPSSSPGLANCAAISWQVLPDISCYLTLSPNPPTVHTGVPND